MYRRLAKQSGNKDTNFLWNLTVLQAGHIAHLTGYKTQQR